MSSSYFITFGGNRVTYPGVTGPVAWEYVPPSGYHETLLWSGQASNGTLNLSSHPSAYDCIRIIPGGDNQGNNSLLYNPLEVSWRTLSSTNNIVFENAMFGDTASSGVNKGWWFGGQLTGCSGTSWTFDYAYGRRWIDTGHAARYDFAQIREVWGITYG